MKALKFLSVLLMILTINSCNTRGKKEEKTKTGAELTEKKGVYSIDTAGAVLQWTAYKFTDKVAVNGTFDSFELHIENRNTSLIEELLQGAVINININSVNSGETIRDTKLRTYFFDVFGTDTIKGEIKTTLESKGEMILEMNAIANQIGYTYKMKNDTVFLSSAINLSHWEGEEAMISLNQECYELHMGADGISKLWPNVDITIKLPLETRPHAD
ncbi:hypothetical protein DKG77_06265 [Flagellimonas aquimarina]|uniref:Lipid/polyisoprenoid-binding YceI-like domain-containing protein n=1 Tax=Flagellimonas aquimarina TaxID=2201895 RepID=A0A316L661_9FLAO|nr:YceI family protein [Allomuricauda koreensis]PWL40415.1 hypothetical protein DKG77_06265 [Allomuricauda koreensis]